MEAPQHAASPAPNTAPKPLLSPREALTIVLDKIQPTGTENIPHAEVLGRTLAENLVALEDLPPFANSAMDGFGVVAKELQAASPSSPVKLVQGETVAAGGVPSRPLAAGTCCKIMTGAPIPPGCDAVVMREDVEEAGGRVSFTAPVTAGTNIRHAGSDIHKGETVLACGTRIGGPQWAMLAALGQAFVAVYRRPRVAIVATGAELMDVGTPLLPGQIRDSNSFALLAACQECDAVVAHTVRVGDSEEEVRAVLSGLAPEVDLIVTSGGVSAGDFDPVRDVLHKHGKVHFWKVAMKPGKPVLFASFAGTPVLALPGNPVSVMVAWEIFVRPALLKMSGRRAWYRPEIAVQLQQHVHSPAGRAEYVRAVVDYTVHPPAAKVTGDQGSGRLSSMLGAAALLKVPADATLIEKGQCVQAMLVSLPESMA